MYSPSTLDREAFQQLLANAFAIQQSQIDPQSLAAIMEVQRSLASGRLDLDSAMTHIVESARQVANASGVAIALLKGDRLSYRAGSGTSAAHAGRQVAASLTVSADDKTSREILRVENAHTDKRIEADICRQFGAGALLILPIYQDRCLAGIFDVRFEQAHPFQEPEVRTYRLMAEQIEAALIRAAQTQPEKTFIPAPPLAEAIAPEALESGEFPDAFPEDAFVSTPEFMMLPENEHSLYARSKAVLGDIGRLPLVQHCAALTSRLTQRVQHLSWPKRPQNLSIAKITKSPAFQRSTEFASTLKQQVQHLSWPKRPQNLSIAKITKSPAFPRSTEFASTLKQRAKNLTWPKQRRGLTVAAVGLLLVFAAAVAYRNHNVALSVESSPLPASNASVSPAVDQNSVIPKPTPGKRTPETRMASAESKPVKPNSALKRVRVSPTEVDYIGEDVTVRFFNDKPAPKRVQAAHAQVTHFGNDVTVRYFTPNQPTTRTASR
jgi:hypothetical protein